MEASESESRTAGPRISVTFSQMDYDQVRALAQEKKVSAAWVVRDAVEKYLKEEHQDHTECRKNNCKTGGYK